MSLDIIEKSGLNKGTIYSLDCAARMKREKGGEEDIL
jgi:hypothetical protein